MNKKTIWQLLALAVIAGALIFGLPAITNRNGDGIPQQENSQSSQDSQNNQQLQTVTLTIEELYSNKQVAITTDQTVLQVLQSLNNADPQVRLSTKEYSGLGTLVESMAGQTNRTNDEYWQYKVNGMMPQIGADQYKLKAGDSIEWYFTKPDSSEGA